MAERSRSRNPAVAYHRVMRGRLYAGTSGFSYPAWAPRFYPPGRARECAAPAYAARLNAV